MKKNLCVFYSFTCKKDALSESNGGDKYKHESGSSSVTARTAGTLYVGIKRKIIEKLNKYVHYIVFMFVPSGRKNAYSLSVKESFSDLFICFSCTINQSI